ncbi:hypothetical protein OIU84_005920 [Salix udensis]|uniref:Fungal lipase-type domain-containing protein n=1 Tax=Salix udensis TaxID=889485 RepID=A0AAD6JXI5_9ROSI|nr:hypothetical protein OIU84_005920 [Salix udensis]
MSMTSTKFPGNYLVLRPEEVSYLDVFRILWNDDIEKKAFVNFPDGKEENLRRRWLTFLSLLSQKILQSIARPMASFGSRFEMWLNLVSCNRNIFVLFINYLRGRVERPVKESETFLSFVGHLDKRVDLDRNIKLGDSRYYSALSVMAAKVAYENKAFVENAVRNHWKMELIGYYDFWNDFQKKRTTQGFMLHDKNADMIIVAFRGTEAFDADAWSTDFDISWYEFPGKGKIHCGFMKALGLLMDQGWPEKYKQEDEQRPIAYYTIREKLKELLEQNETTKFILTGHSMGGAIATLFPAVLAMHHETGLLKRLEGVYTFGQPRVGDEEFKRFMESLMQNHGFKYLRFVYCNDVVTRLPIDDSTFLFKHFGTCVYHNSCYNGKIVSEEPHKNYISVFAAIPRFLNALWELARSFILPCRKGLDYKESWLLILVRWYGLILPGLSAHTPQDYVNITRLGPETIFRHLQDPESGSVSDSDETKD